jgi:hypothetical protein
MQFDIHTDMILLFHFCKILKKVPKVPSKSLTPFSYHTVGPLCGGMVLVTTRALLLKAAVGRLDKVTQLGGQL